MTDGINVFDFGYNTGVRRFPFNLMPGRKRKGRRASCWYSLTQLFDFMYGLFLGSSMLLSLLLHMCVHSWDIAFMYR